MARLSRRISTTVACMIVALASTPLFAAPPTRVADGQGSSGLGREWTPIDPGRLDSIRGGFQLPGGPLLAFGIERLVHVNGQLVAQSAVRIPDIANITTEQAQALAEFNRGLVVQIGEGNHVMSGAGTGGLVIQNSLDNQRINATTRLDVSVDTLGIYKALNFNDVLVDAQMGALGR